MSDVVIFMFGTVVFGVVCCACLLIAWGMVTEKRDRAVTDAEADAAGAHLVSTATAASGRTSATGPIRGTAR